MTGASEIENVIATSIFEHYIKSHDFNGLPVYQLMETVDLSIDKLRALLSNMIRDRKITLCFLDSGNPHIKRHPDYPIERQIEKLNKEDLRWICAYPAPEVLELHFGPHAYLNRPYTRELYLGAPQLEARFFDMAVLERYKNDPRYMFNFEYFSGKISIASEYYKHEEVPQRDQVIMQSFGVAINENGDRTIAAFLRYLHGLTPEHQQYWKSYEIDKGTFGLVPEYFRPSILGEFPTHQPIYRAVIKEIEIINEMCSKIAKPNLFRKSYNDSHPIEFGMFLRPTLNDFNQFIHIADKLLSENLNKDFFASWSILDLEETVKNKDGTHTRRSRGTVTLLDEWLRKCIWGLSEEDIVSIVEPFRKIRKLRQKPAHAINANKYDRKYGDEQRVIMGEIYVAVRFIRLVFMSHPELEKVKVPGWLQEGRIRNY